MTAGERRRDLALLLAGLAVLAATAIFLHAIGHPWICRCGTVELWYAETYTEQDSQHLTDWYTPSHVIHGFLFYFGLWLVAPRLPLSARAFLALLVEAGWEIIENLPVMIERYREVTISLNYFGDSVINTMVDILAMLLGFALAARLPVWLSVVACIAMEVIVAAYIRDNLTLNVVMLLFPIDAIRDWQAAIAPPLP
jgi:hypothetical protein